jgi:hypothetical protein
MLSGTKTLPFPTSVSARGLFSSIGKGEIPPKPLWLLLVIKKTPRKFKLWYCYLYNIPIFSSIKLVLQNVDFYLNSFSGFGI